MTFGLLSHSTDNLGDDIQSLAVERLLPSDAEILRADRDNMAAAADWGPDVRWIINGWHAGAERAQVWPHPGRARKLFVGYHATKPDALPAWLGPDNCQLLGCRDPWTLGLAAQAGLPAWLSWCATMTLDRPDVRRDAGVLFVDIPDWMIGLMRLPSWVVARRRGLSHSIDPALPPPERAKLAAAMLRQYAAAALVVTTRLHVALPCAAFGTPCILADSAFRSPRFGGLADFVWQSWNAPYDDLRPRLEPAAIRRLADPLRAAVQQFAAE